MGIYNAIIMIKKEKEEFKIQQKNWREEMWSRKYRKKYND